MKIPAAYEDLECPRCEGPVYIPVTLAGEFWLDNYWRCPHCKSTVRTEEWKETGFVQSGTQDNTSK